MQKLAGLKEDLRNSLMETASLRSEQVNHQSHQPMRGENGGDSQSESGRSETSQSGTYYESEDDEESQPGSGKSESSQSEGEDSEEEVDHEKMMTSYEDNGEEDFVNIEDYDVIKHDRNQLLAVNKVRMFCFDSYLNVFIFFCWVYL